MGLFPLRDSNPIRSISFQYVTVSLIAICVAVFLWQLTQGAQSEKIAFSYGTIPAVLFGSRSLPPDLAVVPPWATLVTAMFLHGGIMHLFGNMLFLWIFGDNVEDSMGHVRYLVFYLLCGILAGLAHAAVDPASQIPAIGASGAISGVLGAYLVLHPKARVLVIMLRITMVWLPAWIVLGLWIGFQVLSATMGGGGGVAWWAHIGGFVAGAILIVPFRRRGVPLLDGMGGLAPVDDERLERDERRHARSIFPNTVSRRGPWTR